MVVRFLNISMWNDIERKGLEPTSQYLDIIDVTTPTITRVTYRVTELFNFKLMNYAVKN